MEKKVYGYDVYYRLKTTSCKLVAASSEAEAQREFKKWFENASREELVDRFLAALDFEPEVQITYVDKVDKLTEEDLASFNPKEDK